MAKYDYNKTKEWENVEEPSEAVRLSLHSYLRGQLGWEMDAVEERIRKELRRENPKGLFDTQKEYRDWSLNDARLIDVGAGQGAGVLEALHRGANAHGIEPGPEFAALARRRLDEAGYDPERVHETGGEELPFPDESFDYAISLQVLEHVEDPRPLLEEMYRVLRPGGEAVVRCEIYLAFREQHYRVPWLPMLPKSIGSAYLRAIGRDPGFLENYVYYTTYPQIWKISSGVGFENRTYEKIEEKAKSIEDINSESYRIAGKALQFLPKRIRRLLAVGWMHATNLFTIGVNVHLTKPNVQL